MLVDISGLDPGQVDSAFRQVHAGVSEREVRAFMAACRIVQRQEELDKLTAEAAALSEYQGDLLDFYPNHRPTKEPRS